jgi:hypothetical protein
MARGWNRLGSEASGLMDGLLFIGLACLAGIHMREHVPVGGGLSQRQQQGKPQQPRHVALHEGLVLR